jgi:signal peptidase I
MFQPKYLKQAKLLHKGVTRFLDYKKDLLPQAKVDEILSLRTKLEEAMKARDEHRLEELAKTINQTCERALPEARTSAWAENVEVFFVSIVIALGIRAYIAQPFQIPTGSMQPTLNGITAERTDEDPNPGMMGKALGFFTGTTYLNAISDHDGYIDTRDPDMRDVLEERHFLIFRPYCVLHFEDGHTLSINCPHRQLLDEMRFLTNLNLNAVSEAEHNPDMRARMRLAQGARIHIKEGQVLARGLVHNGDHVIVNKFAYHFRRPARGEVFVFTTKNISFIESTRDFDPKWGSQHYIKRLVGLPGDTIDVQSPEIIINGKKATEAGIRRVIDQRKPLSERYAYHGYSPDHYIDLPVTLNKGQDEQYFAMGDNSYSSSDSRYWGPVPEQNVVGPGMFCYWPLTRHWGVIR